MARKRAIKWNTMTNKLFSINKGVQRWAAMCVLAMAALTVSADNVMTKQSNGTYVVRTNTICKARGYRKGTPVEVHIKMEMW